jgi:hypothetical protein
MYNLFVLSLISFIRNQRIIIRNLLWMILCCQDNHIMLATYLNYVGKIIEVCCQHNMIILAT